MNRSLLQALVSLAAISITGCSHFSGGTDLSEVARESGLSNVTTGDGTYEEYTTTGHYTASEIGIAIGLPFVGTLLEIVPARSNDALAAAVAKDAKLDGAEGLINVKPHESNYSGIPFIIIGIYVDKCEGTGIVAKH